MKIPREVASTRCTEKPLLLLNAAMTVIKWKLHLLDALKVPCYIAQIDLRYQLSCCIDLMH